MWYTATILSNTGLVRPPNLIPSDYVQPLSPHPTSPTQYCWASLAYSTLLSRLTARSASHIMPVWLTHPSDSEIKSLPSIYPKPDNLPNLSTRQSATYGIMELTHTFFDLWDSAFVPEEPSWQSGLRLGYNCWVNEKDNCSSKSVKSKILSGTCSFLTSLLTKQSLGPMYSRHQIWRQPIKFRRSALGFPPEKIHTEQPPELMVQIACWIMNTTTMVKALKV